MRTLVSCILFAVTCECQTFKGHRIGETPSEFLTAEPELKQKLDGCLAEAPRELTPDEIREKYGKKRFKEYEQQVAAAPAGSHVAVYGVNPEYYRDRCEALISATRDGIGHIDGTGYLANNPHSSLSRTLQSDRSLANQMADLRADSELARWRGSDVPHREFTFASGKLVGFSYSMYVPYETVVSDVKQRIGSEGKETLVPYHNGYGATWTNASMEWVTSEIHVTVYEDRNPTKHSGILLGVETRAALEERIKKQAERKSSLD